MKLKRLLNKKDHWTQGAYARDEHGEIVRPSDSNAVCWCVLGGLMRCYPDRLERDKIEKKLREIINDNSKPYRYMGIVSWQDYPTRTFEEVCELLEKANV